VVSVVIGSVLVSVVSGEDAFSSEKSRNENSMNNLFFLSKKKKQPTKHCCSLAN
jgi:hypothetical protein